MHLIGVLCFLVNFNVSYMLIAIFYCIKLVGFWWNSLVRIEIWTSWDSDFWFELSAVEYGSNTWILGFDQDLTIVRSPSLWNDRMFSLYFLPIEYIYILDHIFFDLGLNFWLELSNLLSRSQRRMIYLTTMLPDIQLI